MNFCEEGNGSSRTLGGDRCSQSGGSATGDDDVKLLHLDVAPSDGGAVVTGCRSSQFYSKRAADGNLNDLPENFAANLRDEVGNPSKALSDGVVLCQ